MGNRQTNNIATLASAFVDYFDVLTDDLVMLILVKISSDATFPLQFLFTLFVCKRFNRLGLDPNVLCKAPINIFAITPDKWSPSANRFLQRCSDAGNNEASYILGMIHYYCLHNRRIGATLMARAVINSHAPALYSLGIRSKDAKDLTGGFTLCARAAFLGHLDALREVGHYLVDTLGTGEYINEGEKLLVEANGRLLELTGFCSKAVYVNSMFKGTPLILNDNRGHTQPQINNHPANRFLVGWYRNRVPDFDHCGRPETRLDEFLRCFICGKRDYCSHGCRARDWIMGHSLECRPRAG